MNSPRAGVCLTNQWRSRERSCVRRLLHSLALPVIAWFLLALCQPMGERLHADRWGFLSSELKAGDRIRTGDVQLGKLTFYH